MYTQPNFHFNHKLGKVDGLQNVGGGVSPYIADCALVFMINEINKQWKQSVTFYLVKSGTKTYELKKLIRLG